MRVALVAIALLACSPKPHVGPCEQRSGTYVSDSTPRQGNCGVFHESVDTITSQPTAPEPPCTGTISYSADNCQVTFDVTCPVTGGLYAGDVIEQRGEATWDQQGSMGTSVFEAIVTDDAGTVVCTSTFDGTDTRK